MFNQLAAEENLREYTTELTLARGQEDQKGVVPTRITVQRGLNSKSTLELVRTAKALTCDVTYTNLVFYHGHTVLSNPAQLCYKLSCARSILVEIDKVYPNSSNRELIHRMRWMSINTARENRIRELCLTTLRGT